MINVGGNNVNPIEVESVIDQIEGVEKSFIYETESYIGKCCT